MFLNICVNVIWIQEQSLFALDHDDVVAELGLDGGVGVHGFWQAGHRQREGWVLEGTNLRKGDHDDDDHDKYRTAINDGDDDISQAGHQLKKGTL